VKLFETTLPVETRNWSNQSQGFSRAATFAKARAKAQQRDLTQLVLMPKHRQLQLALAKYGGLVILLRRLAPSNGLDPDDNLRLALKWVKDGVAKVLQVDDRDSRIQWLYDQRREKDYGVEIEIAAPPADSPLARR